MAASKTPKPRKPLPDNIKVILDKSLKPAEKKPAGKMGRPGFKRDENTANLVAMFVGVGVTRAALAFRLKIAEETLNRLYKDELAHGKEIAHQFYAGSLARAAQRGNVEAIKFALSRKFGWTETQKIAFVEDDADGIMFAVDKPAATDDDANL